MSQHAPTRHFGGCPFQDRPRHSLYDYLHSTESVWHRAEESLQLWAPDFWVFQKFFAQGSLSKFVQLFGSVFGSHADRHSSLRKDERRMEDEFLMKNLEFYLDKILSYCDPSTKKW